MLFEAVIIPHRSLSVRGRWILIGALSLLCAVTSLRFWLLGAWPVAGFNAIEIGLAVWLLSLNARRGRASELVMLTPSSLKVVRVTPGGQHTERALSTAWLNVVLEERPGRVPGLLLVSRDVREEIGGTLGEAERRDLARALSEALHQARNPRFNNPQLQD
jgi:uncharacterized membrane protein